MIKTHKRVGSQVTFKYPTHGKLNVLRCVVGEVVKKGTGPHGPYLTVTENSGITRSFSTKKIVES